MPSKTTSKEIRPGQFSDGPALLEYPLASETEFDPEEVPRERQYNVVTRHARADAFTVGLFIPVTLERFLAEAERVAPNKFYPEEWRELFLYETERGCQYFNDEGEIPCLDILHLANNWHSHFPEDLREELKENYEEHGFDDPEDVEELDGQQIGEYFSGLWVEHSQGPTIICNPEDDTPKGDK